MADAPWKSEAIRERAAKAIHQESVAHPWEVLSDVQREPWRNRADAVLDAVGQVLYDQGRDAERERIEREVLALRSDQPERNWNGEGPGPRIMLPRGDVCRVVRDV